MFQFVISILAVILAGLIQHSSIFIYGVKPNLALALLLVLSLINRSWIDRLMLAIVSAFMISAYPGFDPQSVIFLGVSLFTMLFIDIMPWIKLINLIIGVVVATFAINLYQFNLTTVLLEILYNLIIALALFLIISKNIKNEKRDQF